MSGKNKTWRDMVNGLMKPAIALMLRLNYPQKMLWISIIFMVPLVAAAFLLIDGFNEDIELAVKEQHGLEYISALRHVYQSVPQHRGLTNAYLNGASELRSKILAKRADILRAFEAVDKVNEKYGNEFFSQKQWSAIKSHWQQLEQKAFEGEAGVVFADHTKIVAEMSELFKQVSQQSGLGLDATLETAFMIDILVNQMPALIESLAQSRGVGSGIAAKKSVSLEQRIKLGAVLTTVKSTLDDVLYSVSVAYQEDDGLQGKIGGVVAEGERLTRDFEAKVLEDIVEASVINEDPVTIFSSGTLAIDAHYQLYDALMPLLTELLQDRTTALSDSRNITLSILLVSILLLVYFGLGFYWAVMETISLIVNSVDKIAEGDLSIQIDSAAKDELGDLAHSLNNMVSGLQTMMALLSDHSVSLAQASTQLSAATEQSKNGSLQQHKQTEQIAQAMGEMSTMIDNIAQDASSVSSDAEKVNHEAGAGGEVIRKTVASINGLVKEVNDSTHVIQKLESNANDIASVLDVISSIADQTNLLALNAAIEAARAGEHGRGFAVVADEVRTLASRTQDATAKIQEMVGSLQHHTNEAVKVMGSSTGYAEEVSEKAIKASESIDNIVISVGTIMDKITQVANASHEQNKVVRDIDKNVSDVSGLTDSNVELSNQIALAGTELEGLSNELRSAVEQFKT